MAAQTHELKCWPNYYDAIERGEKTFEVRRASFSVDSLTGRLQAALPDERIVDRQLLTEYDSYYYSRGQQTPLPILRVKFDDPEIAEVLRGQLASGKPALSKDARPNIPSPEAIRGKVSALLEEQINPAVAGHGGSIHLVEVKDATVFLRMAGGCQGCASSKATLKGGVERALRDAIPELDDIVDVTDHHSGDNPYYS